MDIENTSALAENQRHSDVSQKRSTDTVCSDEWGDVSAQLLELLHVLNQLEPPLLGQLDLSNEGRSSTQKSSYSNDDVKQSIDLFFDYMLSAEHCSFATKTLMGVLYNPVRQLSNRGSGFLTNVQHPARRLIKAVYQASSSLSPQLDIDTDPKYLAMLEIVTSIAEEFHGDERLFLRAYFELNEVIQSTAL